MPSLDRKQNLFAAGSEIVKRLQDTCPGLRLVVQGMDLVEESGVALPMAVVMALGTRIDQQAKGKDLVAYQSWQVQVYASRNASEDAYAEAGYLMMDVLQALHGWRPKCATRCLYLLDTPEHVFHEKQGFAVFAHTFELPVLLRTAN